MLLAESPSGDLHCAHPFPTLCSGCGTSVREEKQQDRETGFVRSWMLGQTAGLIVPCHCELYVSRAIDDAICEMIEVLIADWEVVGFADDAVVASRRENEDRTSVVMPLDLDKYRC